MTFQFDTSAEQWRPMPDWEGFYEVSSLGNVRSLTRTIERAGKTVTIQGLLMRQKINRTGYKYVNVSRGNQGAALLVHRLVALAFLPNPDGLPIVNHLDSDRLHNAAVNLEWCSEAQNMRHAIQKERFGMQRLALEQVLAIRRAYEEGEPPASIAMRFPVGVRHVWKIGTRRAYTHIEETPSSMSTNTQLPASIPVQNFETDGKSFRFQWTSDQEFDGLRLEALDGEDVVLDVSVPRVGLMTVTTFSRDVPADLVEAAIAVARADRAGWR